MPDRDHDSLPVTIGHVTLRRLAPRDLPAFLAYRSDPEVARYQSWGEADEQSARRLIAAMADANIPDAGAWSQIAVADQGGALLGDMGLYLSDDATEAELGITLARAAQGGGVAATAVRAAAALLFRTPTLRRIVAIADKRNIAAITCMEATGFRFTHEADFTEDDGAVIREVHYEMRRTTG